MYYREIEFDDFVELLKKEIMPCLPENYRDTNLSVRKVVKVNDNKYTSLDFIHPQLEVSPGIRLEPLFELWKKGESMNVIARKAIKAAFDSIDTFDAQAYLILNDFGIAKNLINFRLVNTNLNRAYLSDKPYREYFDLAIIYVINIDYDEVCSTITITNKNLNDWEICENELYENALSNLLSSNDKDLRPIGSVIEEMFNLQSLDERKETCMFNFDVPMLVLSNKAHLYGAHVMFDTSLLRLASKCFLDSDLYLIPSSVHEIIITPVVPAILGDQKDNILDMIQDVNSLDVPNDLVLSNNLYYYNVKEDKISCIENKSAVA